MFFLSAGIWELFRFVIVFLASVAAPAAARNAHLNLLWLGGPGVVLAALFFSSAFYADRIRAYIPILRIGAAIAVIVDAAVVLSGSYNRALPGAVVTVTAGDRVLFILAFGVLVLDLIVVSILLSYRFPSAPTRTHSDAIPANSNMSSEQLPEYDPTNLDER